jgi:hypothetical protein
MPSFRSFGHKGIIMRYFVIIAVLAGVIGCDTSPGPDAISSHSFLPGGGGCSCHGAAVGLRRQILGSGGDFASNPSVTSHHVAGATDPTGNQCLVCHDLSQHTLGTVLLKNADSGAVILYSSSSPSSLEPFCLSCHDANGAGGNLSPFADGAALGTIPFIGGTTIASSWSGSSLHRSNGLTCAGTGQPNTGCHGTVSTVTGTSMINMHGSTVRGLLTNTMNFQVPLVTAAAYSADPLGSSWNYANYKLCFDCHESYPAVTKNVVLGYLSGGVYDRKKSPSPYSTSTMRSLFRDRYIGNPANYPLAWGGIDQPYNDTMWSDPYLALHNYHLLGFEANALVDPTVNMLQWKYRGDPARTGRITCTACHNVHGTAAPTIRSTHTELGLQKDYDFFGNGYTPFPGESYTSLDPFIDAAIMSSYPMNCAIDCHGFKGQSSYWHTPNGE